MTHIQTFVTAKPLAASGRSFSSQKRVIHRDAEGHSVPYWENICRQG
ncbi:hypothetical protein QE361_001918 [Sphingomonas sp. SORGH_AS802]|nr:hypothetical protein [Sphingomonas sp. SORGH_AS_0802]MDR6134935.1 hypothetical protein [Sphingomonas sp. SORGH_AS_0802]